MAAPASNWREGLASYRAAYADMTAYEVSTYLPAKTLLDEALAAVPPVVIPYKDDAGFDHELRSDDRRSVSHARRVTGDADEWEHEPAGRRDPCRELMDGIEHRDARLAQIQANSDIEPMFQRMTDLEDETERTIDAAIATPICSVSELHEKMELIAERGGFDVTAWTDALMSDIRRLAAIHERDREEPR
jgi:hypothetical protein